ncbi:hypothetical protein RSOLAG1IB_00084 [Rhizoctonia solani AG-1 IB]|uniref:CHAT domain-containing protein n=1 Tax=Thanatephorus cucumeris (strain AG1-IB / isolate 7/3/14) TaxID=1108050 RepID=A0A0B7F3M9_THACB|nr:hypothetical protein RSOLAG1IB_00084 [Rhizoctonia solani AG-1 IB]
MANEMPLNAGNSGPAHARVMKTEIDRGVDALENDKKPGEECASQLLNGPPRDVFMHALHWATLASEHSYPCSIEAFRAAIDLLPHFIWLGSTTAQRYHDISSAKNLAVGAVSAAILSSEHTLALEWLEYARCVVWSQSLMLRSPLNTLQSLYPELAAALQTVSDRLHLVSSEGFTSQGTDHSSITIENRLRLSRDYSALLSRIRALSGFEDFLRPKKGDAFARAARHGPVVVINCHGQHCAALVILPNQASVGHVPLPNVTEADARKAQTDMRSSLQRKHIRERGVRIMGQQDPNDCFAGVLAALWYNIVKPVLDYLGYTTNVPAESLPHITWCPTGILSFLPLHAAGDYSQPGSRVFSYAVSSYTPTLTALLASTPSTLTPDSRVLAIGQAATANHTPLPGIIDEIASIKSHIGHKHGFSQLMDDQATKNAVLSAMKEHHWVHLACHASQDVKNPTKSGFFLHDGTLDLMAINRCSFRNKGLAFLSACQTAKGDEELADEAVHLASGMLMAGYPSVIATMWSVADSDAPLVADKVYEQLMKEGKVGNGEAGRALHSAVAELRGKVGEKEFGRWVPYIHIGS